MTTLLILFFLSLTGISLMIGRKLVLIRSGNVIHVTETPHRLVPDFQTIKYIIYQKTRQGGYVATVLVIRAYVGSSNIVKNIYAKTKEKIQNWKKAEAEIKKKEASKFLKMISDYKHKVKNIKRQIEEESK